MFIQTLSPSAVGAFNFCQMQFFCNYVLKYRTPAGKKANMGTAFHKIMEILAMAKKYNQDTGETKFILKEKTIGQYEFNTKTWFKPASVKIGRSTYNVPGKEVIDDIFFLVYAYYANLFSYENWDEEERDSIQRWVYSTIDLNDGLYDPRKRTIISPEERMSYAIGADWGKFNYGDGVEGTIVLNGVIDLITDLGDGTVEVIDWKSGQRKNWATGEKKSYDDLKKDFQLMFYYYLLNLLFPQYKNIILTIFFINDGGPFSICYERSDLERIEQEIKNNLHTIMDCSSPEMIDRTQKSFKCQKLCPYYKMELDGTNMCKAVVQRIKLQGIDKVTQELRK